VQFSSVEDMLENSQRTFWALELAAGARSSTRRRAARSGVRARRGRADGALTLLGSTWSAENDVIYDGISRPGARLVSFAGILKQDLFPLAELLEEVLALGAQAWAGRRDGVRRRPEERSRASRRNSASCSCGRSR
jgi:hypothetical protein